MSDPIWVVRVQSWSGDYIVYSIHKTRAGAETYIAKANAHFATMSAFVDEEKLYD